MICNNRVGVIIPCYRVKESICSILTLIPDEVDRIYVIDDCCPDDSGSHVILNCTDQRVLVVKSSKNHGVGGATIMGYLHGIRDGLDILVKMDGDGQMNPLEIFRLLAPINDGGADYTKGNRFFSPMNLKMMPIIRVIGNIFVSYISRLSTGYWSVFDVTNGYTAVRSDILRKIDLDRIDKRYFFESDMLFNLKMVQARVIDVPTSTIYRGEVSDLRISENFGPFMIKYLKNFITRIRREYIVNFFSIRFCLVMFVIFFLIITFGIFVDEGFSFPLNELYRDSLTPVLKKMVYWGGLVTGGLILILDIISEPSTPLWKRLESS